MLRTESGKLMVCASNISAAKKRLNSVKTATEKMAKQLNLDFEMLPQQRGCAQIYVYYENGQDDPIPLYCDEGKTGDFQEIVARLKNMMFVLSFHPRHTALAQVRNSIIRLS